MQCAAPSKFIACIALAASLLANGDCPPECRGECFAGHCLFSAADIGDTFATSSVSLPVTPNAVSPAASIVRAATSTANLPRSQPEITPNAVSARASVSMAMQQPHAPAYDSPSLKGFQSTRRSPWSEYQAAEASNTQLLKENAVLREQLRSWHNLGLKIASRETQTAAFLAAEAKRRSTNGGLQLIQNGQAANATALEQAFNEVPRSAILSIEIAAILVIVYAMYQGRAFAMNFGREGQPLLHKQTGAARHGTFAYLASPLRSTAKRLGLVDHKVEIAELTLGNLSNARGSLSVSVKIGATGQIFNTHSVPAGSSSASFLMFKDEVFEAKIRRMGGPCVFSVIDHDTPMKDCVAMAQIPAATLIDLAAQRQDYFQLPLTEGPWRPETMLENAADAARAVGQPPCLAMRLRDAGSGSHNAFADASSTTLRNQEIPRGRKQARPNRVEWPDEDGDDYVVRA